MNKRKLIKFGKNSYVISLPKEWIEENKLGKGSEINLNKFDENLIISTESNIRSDSKEIIINCHDKDLNLIKRLILSSYISNFSTIIIKEFSPTELNNIKKIITNLFAVEIFEESQNKIIIKDILNITDISLIEIIRRTDNIIRTMFNDSIDSFDETLTKDVIVRDDDVNRLSYLALKVLKLSLKDSSVSKILKLNGSIILHAWELIARLENISDSTKRISSLIANLKLNTNEKKNIADFLMVLKSDYINVMKSFYNKDERLVYDILSKSLEKRMKIYELTNMKNELNYVAVVEQLYNIHESIKNIARSLLNTILIEDGI